MKLLIVADIHGNWPALRAVLDDVGTFDACLCLGDLVEYGPEPAPCVDWARAHADVCIRGNHDHNVAQRVSISADHGYRYLTAATRPGTCAALDGEQRRYLRDLPLTATVRYDSDAFFLVHGTPRDPLDEYLGPNETARWKQRLAGIEDDFVLVGHTHLPFVFRCDGVCLLNPGSVGQPRDGDPRAAYAVVENGRPTLCRVEYPIEETITAMNRWSIPSAAKELAAEVWRHGGMGWNGMAAPRRKAQ